MAEAAKGSDSKDNHCSLQKCGLGLGEWFVFTVHERLRSFITHESQC